MELPRTQNGLTTMMRLKRPQPEIYFGVFSPLSSVSFFLPFPLPFLAFSSLFSPPRTESPNPAKGFGEGLLAPSLPAREYDI